MLGSKQFAVGGTCHVYRIDIVKYVGNGVGKVLVDVPFLVAVHVHVDYHDTAVLQMIFDHREEFHRRHLERNGDVLIGIHHDDIIGGLHRLQKSPAVIGGHLHIFRQGKVFAGELCDFFIDLHALDIHITEVFPALGRIGSGSHAEDQHIHILYRFVRHHEGSRHGIVIVHTGQSALFHIEGLDTEQHVGGQNHLSVRLRHLQIIVDGLAFVSQILLPKSKGIRISQTTAQNKNQH